MFKTLSSANRVVGVVCVTTRKVVIVVNAVLVDDARLLDKVNASQQGTAGNQSERWGNFNWKQGYMKTHRDPPTQL